MRRPPGWWFPVIGIPRSSAIDADLNAGLIGEDEAKKRRSEVTQEADFYGSMVSKRWRTMIDSVGRKANDGPKHTLDAPEK